VKSVFIVRLKAGYLVMEREIATFTPDELVTGTVVEDDAWNHRDKVGRIAADILNPPKESKDTVEPANA
jgi:hypothetical protein